LSPGGAGEKPRLRRAAAIASAGALVIAALVPLAPLGGQLVPNDEWKTIQTQHFRVHFTPPLEQLARHSAATAERAYLLLSRELVPPRGKIDLVVADNVDFTNGYATPFPSNRIVVYAHPPVEEIALRYNSDWTELVITHELTHIFHLDRTRGLWKLGRYLFGRHPAFFPNAYMPAWITEGLAVYYESRITGTGRLEGSTHYMVARAAAEAGSLPRLGELSSETSRFPRGEVVYTYGGFIFDHLSRTRGEKTIRDFVELTSGSIFPLTLNGKSRKAFGISFERAWRQWGDSLLRTAQRGGAPFAGWRELTSEGWIASAPRWASDTRLLYGAATGREVSHAYVVGLDGMQRKIGRRNAPAVNVPLPNGDVLFSQPDLIDAYRLRNDLYVQRGGEETRLTHGARLSSPDARRDGSIVAVQQIPGSTRIVRVAADGNRIQPVTTGALDVQWADPRWSPDGARIAAVRIPRGNRPEIVILDTLGAQRFSRQFPNAVAASPSWSRDGKKLYISSDHSGTMQVYALDVAKSPGTLTRVSNAVTGLFGPEESPDTERLAAVLYHADGYHVGVAPVPRAPASSNELVVRGARAQCADCRLPDAVMQVTLVPERGGAANYSPWRSLLPTYWEPLIESSTGFGTRLGAATSGNDIVGLHSYLAQATFNSKYRETEGFGFYRYSGFGQPLLDFTAEQAWDHASIVNSARENVGDLAQRSRIFSARATFPRPRARNFASVTIGGDIETRDYNSDPDTLLAHLPPLYSQTIRYPSVFGSAAWANTRRPPLSISREDGISISVSARQRWRNSSENRPSDNTGPGGSRSWSRSVIGVTAAYKSLDLPGFAHHVVGLRGAAGYADSRAISGFSAGGLSGTTIEVIAGVGLGNERRTFGVRGFPPSAERGTRAFAGSLEYRAPIAAPSRHVRYIPLLFDRFSATAFADLGRAYCPGAVVQAVTVCSDPGGANPWLASVGAELNLDAAIYYDVPARIRLGFAVPTASREYGRAKSVSTYLTFGSSF
jgi:Tol biopolymer transport system component